jgi:hypothetical protein
MFVVSFWKRSNNLKFSATIFSPRLPLNLLSQKNNIGNVRIKIILKSARIFDLP